MGEVWAVGDTAATAIVGVIAVPHSENRRTSTTKQRLAHHAMGRCIINATSCACPGGQGVSGAASPLTGSCRRHRGEEGIMQLPSGVDIHPESLPSGERD